MNHGASTPTDSQPAPSAKLSPIELRLATRVHELPGVADKRAARFARLGVHTVTDLIRHLPMRYEQEHAEGTIGDLPMEGVGSARGTVTATRYVRGGGGRNQGRFLATLEDHSDRLSLVFFNASYLRNEILPGMVIRVQGKVKAFGGYPQMANPKWEALEDLGKQPRKSDKLRPVYPATDGLDSDTIERIVGEVLPVVLPQITDPLPAAFLSQRNMPALAQAYRMAHQPAHEDEPPGARRRLAYNELLLLQLGIAIKRHYNDTALDAPPLHFSDAMDEHIRARLPFTLTEAQDKVVREIVADLQRGRPMNRLVQGDVGSGKTAVAVYALLMAVADRKQGAMMAPTELLAEQHYRSVCAMLKGAKVRVELLTGAVKAAARNKLLADIESGKADIVIGTHALLTETVRFHDLAVVVVDEQHRFGVRQRAALRARGASAEGSGSPPSQGGVRGGSKRTASIDPSKSKDANNVAASTTGSDGKGTPHGRTLPQPLPQREGSRKGAAPGAPDHLTVPHCLVMTATPIPRTLSLTVFGDLDVSTITALPPGRSPIITRVVGAEKSDDVYQYIAKRIAGGEQAYIVLPVIDERDEPNALRSVEAHVKLLRDKHLHGRRIEAVHGRLDRDDRERIMQRFRDGKVDALVATTVIEVGVDVANATIMVVEHAERFGLSQLHQLRGRVGRGAHGRKSLCVFIADPNTDDARQRMEAIGKTGDGFKIAEADLEIRGMGDFFGTRQHGLPPLRVASIPDDMELLQLAKRDAAEITADDPMLAKPENELLHKVLWREYGETLGLIDVA